MNPKLTESVDVAYTYLRSKILCGSMHAGMRLTTQQLADALKVSRTPIKESLARLESEGLVVREDKWGYSVRDLSIKDAEDIFEARLVIEVACAQKAATMTTNEDGEKLIKILEKTRLAANRGKSEKFLIESRWLHRYIAEMTKNDLLLRMFDQVNSLVLLYAFSIVQSNPNRIKEIIVENEHLVTAIIKRNADLAGEAIRTQVHMARENYRKVILDGRLSASMKFYELNR